MIDWVAFLILQGVLLIALWFLARTPRQKGPRFKRKKY